MARNDTLTGAIHSQVLPFNLYEKRSSDRSNYANLLGKIFDLPDGVQAQLVQLDSAAGLTSPGGRAFKRSGAADYQVTPVADLAIETVGIAPPGLEDLVDDDYFFMLIDGIVEGVKGDDAAAVAVGDFIQSDDDADTGKLRSTAGVFTAGVTIGKARTAQAVDSGTFDLQILTRLGA